MDELYLEWLRSTCGLDREKARTVREVYARIEDLANATPDEIADSCQISLEQAETLRMAALESISEIKKQDDERSELFLCPECGSFISSDSKNCRHCGASFEGVEEETVEAPAEAKEEVEAEPELYICSNCGAFISKDSKLCTTCGQSVEEVEAAEEELPREVAAQVEREDIKVCSHCGAFLQLDAAKCAICGQPFAEEKVPEEPIAPELKEPKGVSRDFLARWQRVAEKTPTREDQLEEELRHYEELLEVDPKLERAWVLKSHVLRELGRPGEAASCLERAAKINPDRSEEYRLQVLNLAESFADSSIIPPRWTALAPREKPEAEISSIKLALDFYERLLRADPRLDVAWETRAELLQRLGRTDEAEASKSRAKEIRRIKIEGEKRALVGLRTVMPRSKGTPKEGRVNGLVNGIGRTNGLVNGIGRTNGLVNGLGRTNGLVNGIGRTNGLVNGLGRTNGLVNGLGRVNGLVNGIGHVNGLVNGNGFTNGRRGRLRPAFRPDRGMFGSAGVIAAIVFILLITPIVATLLPKGPQPISLSIDGDFSDWARIPSHQDVIGDTESANISYRPDLDLASIKVAAQNGQLGVFAEMNGTIFGTPPSAPTPDMIDYIIVMVDTDGRHVSGYRVGEIGAEMLVMISGYEGKMTGKRVLDWRPEFGGGQNNISAFKHRGDVVAASSERYLEFMMPVPDSSIARVMVMSANVTGIVDSANHAIRVHTPTLAVSQRTVIGDIMTQDEQAFLSVRLYSEGGSSEIGTINVTRQGSVEDQFVQLGLYLDDNDGVFEPSDTLLDTSIFAGGMASFDIDMTLDEGESVPFFIVADLTGAPDACSLKMWIHSIASGSFVDLSDALISGAYYRQAPSVTIDGVFGDWDQMKVQKDGLWDVRTPRSGKSLNENVDIVEVGVNVTSDFAFFMKVQGRMLGGEDMPNLRGRPIAAAFEDTDLDTVPDVDDLLVDDFNNDGIPDHLTNNDVDGDGAIEYPDGTDFWLNTTIPDTFPSPYNGRIVSRYIGPISYNIPTGVDTSFAYIDVDNKSSTGLYVESDGEILGVDYALVANGRGGSLSNASLFRYKSGSEVPFEWIRDIAAAMDHSRLEMAVNSSILGLVPGFRIFAYTTDWMRDTDHTSPIVTRGGRYGVRSPAGDDVVLNEMFPSKGGSWIELANPTSSSISLSGWRLEAAKGNKYVTLYTFSTEVIGAWLSGTEYLTVDIPGNNMPNANGYIILRNAANTIVDATTYPNIATGSTWSRLKNENDGKPIDTDSDGDWYVSTYPSRNMPNDRYRPTIAVVKTVNVLTAGPGDFIQYTIYYNNTGEALSRRVWINDTLPSGVTFYSSSVPPSSFSGNTYRWIFANVPAGAPRSLTIIVQVNSGAPDSTAQVNTVTLDYVDQLNRKMGSSVSWANFTCRRPVIKVEKTASPSVTVPGGIVVYTIFFNNTGSANALRVWINDTLPIDVTYLGSSVPPSSWSGQTYRWVFANVVPGPHSFTITVQVKNPAMSSVLVNWVFLNYTSQSGYKLTGSSASATVIIPEFGEVLVPIAIPLFVFAGQRLLKRKKKKSEAVADSVPPTNGR